MSKKTEFEHQLAEVENKILEYEELREDLYKRIDEETAKEEKEVNTLKTFTLNNEQARKLLCLLEHANLNYIEVENVKDKHNLIDFAHDLSWDIAELLEVDLNEGNIDPKTFQFYTYKSRR